MGRPACSSRRMSCRLPASAMTGRLAGDRHARPDRVLRTFHGLGSAWGDRTHRHQSGMDSSRQCEWQPHRHRRRPGSGRRRHARINPSIRARRRHEDGHGARLRRVFEDLHSPAGRLSLEDSFRRADAVAMARGGLRPDLGLRMAAAGPRHGLGPGSCLTPDGQRSRETATQAESLRPTPTARDASATAPSSPAARGGSGDSSW